MENSHLSVDVIELASQESDIISYYVSFNDNGNDDFVVKLLKESDYESGSIKLISEEDDAGVKTTDILHYEVDERGIFCISDNNSEKKNGISDSKDEKTDCIISGSDEGINCDSDFEFDSEVEVITSGCNNRIDELSYFIKENTGKRVCCCNSNSKCEMGVKNNLCDCNGEIENENSFNNDGKSKFLITNYDSGPYVSDDYNILKKKKKTRWGRRPYRCKAVSCKRTFLHFGSLKQHELLHEVNNWKCKYCDKVFKHNQQLKFHLSTHFDKKGFLISYPCFIAGCKEKFYSHVLRQEHEISHNLASKPYVCQICDKKFKRHHQYLKHLLIHSTNSDQKCLECGKVFIYKTSLKQHQVSHEPLKKYYCISCGADFHRYGNFLRHVKIHRSKRFTCEVCNSSFQYVCSLSRHMIKAHQNNNQVIKHFTEMKKRRKTNTCSYLQKLVIHFKKPKYV